MNDVLEMHDESIGGSADIEGCKDGGGVEQGSTG